MSRTSTRLLAVAVGLIAGLIVLVGFASRLSLVGSSPSGGASGSTTPAAAATTVPGARQVKSLAELAKQGAFRSGELVEVRIDEASLNSDITEFIKGNTPGMTVSNTRVRLQPGRVTLTGSLRQGVLATEFTLTGHPAIANSQLRLIVDSIEPGIVGGLSPIQPGQGFELAPNLVARSVAVVERLMVAVGVVK